MISENEASSEMDPVEVRSGVVVTTAMTGGVLTNWLTKANVGVPKVAGILKARGHNRRGCLRN